jgi:hypothetical protein
MTEDQARKIKDPATIPWNEPCFVFVTGRYYLGMWYMEIPRNKEWPAGGNFTAQCWRYNDGTEVQWIFTFRFRYYADSDPWSGRDRKSWYAGKLFGTEDQIEKIAGEFTTYVAGLTGVYVLADPPPVHSLIFKSESEKALDVLEREKPFWMHIKTSP